MMQIDILDSEITINEKKLAFPMSYAEVKQVMGEARIENDGRGRECYIYDDLGMTFEQGDALWLKNQRAYKDADHLITSVHLYITEDWDDVNTKPKNHYVGGVTFCGKKKENNILNRFMGRYQDCIEIEESEYEFAQVGAYVGGEDNRPNYEKDRFLKSIDIVYTPRKPKIKQNYEMQDTNEESLVFDNFNFKLAVINELMYKQEVLKPYFDIYEYMEFKKAHWNLETEKNVRAAVQFFKALPIPVSLASKVTKLYLDGGNEIYMNIAPLWDGEDDRFDIDKLSEAELKQFPNLKSIVLMTTSFDELKKLCEGLGIEASLL